MDLKVFVFWSESIQAKVLLLMYSLAKVQSFNIFSLLDLLIPTAVRTCLWMMSEGTSFSCFLDYALIGFV